MSYLPDYITWRGDLPFAADPANDLDTLVMAALSYIDLPAETQVFAQCAKSVPPDDPDDHFRGECRRLLQQIAKSSRFGALTVRDAVSVLNDEIQFAAMTVDLPDGTHMIAFRGTDGSLTGWREDFAMSFESPVPAQEAAQKYLERHEYESFFRTYHKYQQKSERGSDVSAEYRNQVAEAYHNGHHRRIRQL